VTGQIIEIPSSTAVIGFGGNIGSEAQIRGRFIAAREALRDLGTVKMASLYRTAPMGPAQPTYLNTAISVQLPDEALPDDLMAIILDIERSLGRDRSAEQRWGPRTIDLDVILWGERVVKTAAIVLPHPRAHERRFVLEPLMELLGAHTYPGTPQRIVELRERVLDQPIEKISTYW
jgi:2-amino-4-hydroxy-6-hydroxymethyldihydropteridine diphosphokinase